ncbi:RNA polymerase sigma-70 factor (ECF subfamily) [Paenibacillus shirakamiensis]|uniref:RNA polymerase sigma-70 factor (ECF subfamily) n=1 Tax=Paenibacillus shirakamiensis TaxID=1265935 RepID=A0ABS4JNU9_9BACL|nr:RNA polymerase sigma-70 factor (ECF subfamily) [Paenibacillus shirakamiensis]
MRKIENIVHKAQSGDHHAYIILFEQYEQQLYRTAFVYVNNEQDALDVIQETAYRSFKLIATLREPKYFKTWLIRICITCAMDLLRQRRKAILLTPEHLDFAVSNEDYDVPLSISLQQLIEQLDDDERSVIVLRFYHDFTIKEITEVLQIPLGTGKTILYRALHKLRKVVKEESVYEQ